MMVIWPITIALGLWSWGYWFKTNGQNIWLRNPTKGKGASESHKTLSTKNFINGQQDDILEAQKNDAWIKEILTDGNTDKTNKFSNWQKYWQNEWNLSNRNTDKMNRLYPMEILPKWMDCNWWIYEHKLMDRINRFYLMEILIKIIDSIWWMYWQNKDCREKASNDVRFKCEFFRRTLRIIVWAMEFMHRTMLSQDRL